MTLHKMPDFYLDQLHKISQLFHIVFSGNGTESNSVPNFSAENINATWHTRCNIEMYFDQQVYLRLVSYMAPCPTTLIALALVRYRDKD